MFDKPLQITPKLLWGAVTALAVILSGVAAVTWEIRRDYIDDLKRQLDAYEKSSSWKLPETLNEIRAASNTLNLHLSERKELEALRTESTKFRTDNHRLSEEIKELSRKLADAQSTLDKLLLKTHTFDLAEGQSVALFENNVFLGLRSLYSSSVSVILENKSRSLYVGQSTDYTFANRRCTVTLVKLSPGQASFAHGCK